MYAYFIKYMHKIVHLIQTKKINKNVIKINNNKILKNYINLEKYSVVWSAI